MKSAAVVIVLLLLSTPRAARGSDPLEDFQDPAVAQNLVVEARALIASRSYADACPKLEQSVRLVPDLDTHFELADCSERVGKLATAWAQFVAVADQSKAASHGDREKAARRRARALEPRLPKLVIDIADAPAGLEVRRDGVRVDTAALGAAFPVDPGKHRITATAPGRQRWVTTVESGERTTSRVALPRDLPEAVDSPAPVAAAEIAPIDPLATRKAMRRASAWVAGVVILIASPASDETSP